MWLEADVSAKDEGTGVGGGPRESDARHEFGKPVLSAALAHSVKDCVLTERATAATGEAEKCHARLCWMAMRESWSRLGRGRRMELLDFVGACGGGVGQGIIHFFNMLSNLV